MNAAERAQAVHRPTGVWAEAGTKVKIGGRLPTGETVEAGAEWLRDVPCWDPTVSPGCDSREFWYDDWCLRLAQAKATAREGMLGYSSSVTEGFVPGGGSW